MLLSKTKNWRRMHLKKMKRKMRNYLSQSGFAVPILKAITPMTLWIKWYVCERTVKLLYTVLLLFVT